MEHENDELKAEFAQLLNKSENSRRLHKNEIDELSTALKNSEEENQELLEENVELKKVFDQKEPSSDQLARIIAENERLMKENQLLQPEIIQNRQFIASRENLENIGQEKTIADLEQENDRLRKENEALKNQIQNNSELTTKDELRLVSRLKNGTYLIFKFLRPSKRVDQTIKEPYIETAENQASLKEGVLNELQKTKQQLSEKEKENQDLENIMNTLNKKIDQLKTPEAQQRLKDGALRELHKAQEKINELEKEKDQLTIIAETEKNQKLQEQKLKEGALAEVERLQDQKKLENIEANIIQQRIGFFDFFFVFLIKSTFVIE